MIRRLALPPFFSRLRRRRVEQFRSPQSARYSGSGLVEIRPGGNPPATVETKGGFLRPSFFFWSMSFGPCLLAHLFWPMVFGLYRGCPQASSSHHRQDRQPGRDWGIGWRRSGTRGRL